MSNEDLQKMFTEHETMKKKLCSLQDQYYSLSSLEKNETNGKSLDRIIIILFLRSTVKIVGLFLSLGKKTLSTRGKKYIIMRHFRQRKNVLRDGQPKSPNEFFYTVFISASLS
jgi:hypothetical protein